MILNTSWSVLIFGRTDAQRIVFLFTVFFLAILLHFLFQVIFGLVLSGSIKNPAGIVTGVVLNL